MSNSSRTILILILVLLIWVAGCSNVNPAQPNTSTPQQPTTRPVSSPTPRPSATRTPTLTPLPSATVTSQPTLAPSPTPLYALDLSGYDPDIFQPIDVSHNPPLIARSDETVNEAGYTQRFPGAGTIDLFTTEDFIDVELPVENEVKPGEEVYDFFWGYGPDKVRQATYEGYPQRVGPPAMDVAEDGRIAILDPVNERIIIFNPSEDSYSSLSLPFTYGYWADLAFDPEGRLMVCDFQGEEVPGTFIPIPYCYLLLSDGKLDESTPVYVKSPSKITKDLRILDYSDSRLVAPFSSQGKANSREVQRQKETWEFPKRYVEGQDPYLAHYADMKAEVAFEVHSVSPLGVLTEFGKTPPGYIMTFSLGDRIRAVWIDPDGNVLKDVTLPNGQYSEINFNGQVAVAQDGSLYAMNSTQRGIEIHFVISP